MVLQDVRCSREALGECGGASRLKIPTLPIKLQKGDLQQKAQVLVAVLGDDGFLLSLREVQPSTGLHFGFDLHLI